MIFLLFTVLSINMNSSEAQSSPCDYYIDKSEGLGCGKKNYLVKFGHRYCQKYLRAQRKFSSLGESFLIANRNCLIESLESEDNLSCKNSRDLGFDHHVDCFVDSGFCQIKKSEKLKVFRIAKKSGMEV